VRGPSRSGKTAVSERLISGLGASGLRVAYLKRTHHALDLPEKASGRIWDRGPAAMVIRTGDRLQVTLPAGEPSPASLIAAVPVPVEVILLETHSAEAFPTILSMLCEPHAGEDVIGRWSLDTLDEAAPALLGAVLARMQSRPAAGREAPAPVRSLVSGELAR
jgi:molybdopterin-guanine dinucleotide biosynthesis protein MobB